MASLWKHPNSKFWTACYTDGNGKQRKKSTKLIDKKAAQKVADSLEEAHRRKMSEIQVRKILSEAYYEIHGAELASATIADYLRDWVKRKEKEVSGNTWDKYRLIADRFLEYLGDKANNDLNYLTTKTFVGFRQAITEKLSPSSVNNYLKVLRVAFNEAWRDNLISDNPAAKVPILKDSGKIPGNSRRPFTMEELKKVYNSANDEWRGIIICGLYTGQRLGDIAKLRWTAIDLANKTINFLTSKTSRPTIVPMAEPVYNFIMELGSNDDPNAPLFPNAVKALGKHDRTSHLSNQFYDIMASAGIVPHRPHTKRLKEANAKRATNPLSFHCLRHTATSLLKNRGTAEAVAMDIIGHESKSISQNYTHIDMETKRKAIDSLPDITK